MKGNNTAFYLYHPTKYKLAYSNGCLVNPATGGRSSHGVRIDIGRTSPRSEVLTPNASTSSRRFIQSDTARYG